MQLRALAISLLFVPALVTASQRADAQKKPKADNRSGYDRSARATVLHTANVYVSPDTGSSPIATVTPGHEVVVTQHNGPWVNVFANTDSKEDVDPDSAPEFTDPHDQSDPSSGWIRDKGIVGPTTPNGDALIYGMAAELEAQAAEPHAPKDAASGAHLLYRRVWEYYPTSPLAPEAAYRSADIRWQLDKLDISTLPSAHEQEAYLRPQLYEGEFRHILKAYPDSPFAARAAFNLLDNKLCGDWQGLPKCPEMETTLYLKYAEKYPSGPKSAEAMYNAVYRQAVVVTMYNVDENKKRADDAAKNCQSIADQLRQKYPQSDFAARAASIAFRVQQGIPVYGSDRD